MNKRWTENELFIWPIIETYEDKMVFQNPIRYYYMVVQNPLVLRSDSLIMSQSMKCHQTVITAEYGQTGFMARGDWGYGSVFYIELYTG